MEASHRGVRAGCRSVAVLSAALAGAADGVDAYDLFRPAPRSEMREMSTDRPDRTESPFTVDAGHVQVEMDAVTYTRDERPESLSETFGFAIANLKAGLHDRVDVQLVLESRVSQRITTHGPSPEESRSSGFGNALVRLKLNLWGNDSGPTALGVMPFVALRDEAPVDRGLIVPLSLQLPGELGFGAMVEVDHDRDAGARWIHSITLGRELGHGLGAYVEWYGAVAERADAGVDGTFDTGLSFAFTPNVRADAGVNLGVSGDTPEVMAFVGLSARR